MKVRVLLFAVVCTTTLSIVSASRHAMAQDMSFDVDETATGDASKKSAGKNAKKDATEADNNAEAAPAGEGDVISELAAETSEGPKRETGKKQTKRHAKEEIYAVQQIYALRQGRFELQPSIGFTMNDPYITHNSANVGINYWLTNVLAIGLGFQWYQGLENESDLNFFARRSTRLALPTNEFQLGMNLNFSYVPLYGKFAFFNNNIFQWDAYIVGGLGAMRTRPIPIIDPEIRQFDYDWRLAFNVGLGLRVFVTRYLAIFGELRDFAFLERYENVNVALGAERNNKGSWLADSPTLTNNITAQIGVSIFLPFAFDYKQPR